MNFRVDHFTNPLVLIVIYSNFTLLILFICFDVKGQQSQLYDSLAASDTLNWPQMQYLDSLIRHGVRWQEHTDKLAQLRVIVDVKEKVEQVPEHIQKLDSLLQEKSNLIQEKILNVSSTVQDKVDSVGKSLPFGFQQYTSEMEEVDQLIEEYSSQLTNREGRSWLQDHLSQLQQMDGTLDRLQGKLLDIQELKKLQGYKQQLQELTGQSQGYFREAMGLVKMVQIKKN